MPLEEGEGEALLGDGAEVLRKKSPAGFSGSLLSVLTMVDSATGAATVGAASFFGPVEKLSASADESKALGSGKENCKSFFLLALVGDVTMAGNSIAGCGGLSAVG